MRWTPPLLAIGILAFSLLRNSWTWFRLPPVQIEDDISPLSNSHRFGDLRIVTATASCIRDGTWAPSGRTCDPFGRPFNYPTVWAELFALFELDESRTVLLGVLLGCVVMVTIALPMLKLVRSQQGIGRIITLSFCIASPPIALQLERGNTDGLILAGLGVAVFMHSRNSVVSAAIAGLISGLKLFPVVALAAFLPKRRGYLSLAIFVVAMFGVLILSAESLVRLVEMQEPPGSYRFGSLLLFFHFLPVALNFPRLWVLSSGAILTLVPSLVILVLFRNRIKEFSKSMESDSFGTSLFLLGGLVFVGSFVSGSRYDYSQMFLVMTLLGIALTPVKGAIVDALFGLGLLSLWGAFWVNADFVVGDIATTGCTWVLLAVLIQGRIDVLKKFVMARSGSDQSRTT